MSVWRSVQYFVPFAAAFSGMLALGQQVHFHDTVPEPIVLWMLHPSHFAIGIAAMAGGVLEILLGSSVSWMENPKGPAGVFKRLAFDIIAAVMFLPWVVETIMPNASISAIMAFACMSTTLAPQLVPIARSVFLRQAQDRIERTETRVTEVKQGDEKRTTTEIKNDVVVMPKAKPETDK